MSDRRAAVNASALARMIGVALAAFAFTFALVPLYRIACEKVFGVRLEKGPAEASAIATSKDERWVTVQFDGGVNSKLPWAFRPELLAMRVHPGRQYEAKYFAQNASDHAIVGNAVPSIAPSRASGYFSKTECFCFTAQTLAAGESRDMPCASSSLRICRPTSTRLRCRTPSTRMLRSPRGCPATTRPAPR